jgi:hypothetical protein
LTIDRLPSRKASQAVQEEVNDVSLEFLASALAEENETKKQLREDIKRIQKELAEEKRKRKLVEDEIRKLKKQEESIQALHTNSQLGRKTINLGALGFSRELLKSQIS